MLPRSSFTTIITYYAGRPISALRRSPFLVAATSHHHHVVASGIIATTTTTATISTRHQLHQRHLRHLHHLRHHYHHPRPAAAAAAIVHCHHHRQIKSTHMQHGSERRTSDPAVRHHHQRTQSGFSFQVEMECCMCAYATGLPAPRTLLLVASF